MKTERPPILYGAVILAVLSLVWSGYAIADLMHSGKFGLSVALAGDVGWITVLWAEYKGVTIGGKRWAATAAGWAIALGVAVLLVIHGQEAGGRAQAIAGPFVVLVGKIVWAFALEAMKDPAALTPEQEAEIHTVMRDSEYQGRLHQATLDGIERGADAEIARIRAEARTVLARDEADFEISVERVRKRGEIARRTPLALSAAPAAETRPTDFNEAAEQVIDVIGEQDREQPTTIASTPNTVREQIANKAVNSPNADREQDRPTPAAVTPNTEQPSIADLVREQIANTTDNAVAVRQVLAIRPDANKDSVAAAVRRERRKSQMEDGYA